MKTKYYIRGNNGECITLEKDVGGEYSYSTSLNLEEAEVMDLEFAEEVLEDLNDDGEEYFRICEFKKDEE